MKAEAESFTFLANEFSVKIPFFQRAYVWEESNWKELLADLLDDSKTHFLGSLILKQQKKQSGKTKEVMVIDGQQRLTTLSVLVKVIYDLFPEEIRVNSATTFRNNLFYKNHPTDKDYHVKIQHSTFDKKYYQLVVKVGLDQQALEKIDVNSNKILQCYKYFHGELSVKDLVVIESLFNRILDRDNKIIVLIDLGEEDEEQAIFDTINSAGVRLSAADIIKNALFQRALDIVGNQEEVLEIYKNDWESVFTKDDTVSKYWEAERSTGRLMRDNIEILLHCIAVIKGFFDPGQNTLSSLSSIYKKEIQHLKKDELLAFISEIKDYANLYKDKISSFERTTALSFDEPLLRLLHILDVLELTTFHPFILFLLKKYSPDESRLNAVLRNLERLVMRQMITGSDQTKAYNKFCKEFILDESSIAERLSLITDDAVKEGLEDISNKYATLVLFWVESYRRSADSKYSLKELTYCYSLEHIMPQKWQEFWSAVPVINDAGSVVPNPDEASKLRQKKIYHLGNMTLLTCSLNSALRNYPFEKKMNGDLKKKGVKAYADLSITRDDIVTPFERGDIVWNEAKITSRTNRLTSEVLNLW